MKKKLKPIPPDLAATSDRRSLKAGDIPLDLAMEACRIRGVVFRHKKSAVKRRWRVEYLYTLRSNRKIRTTLDLLALSPSTLYYERKAEPLFDYAVRMVLGEVPWSDEMWRIALEAACAKEGAASADEAPGRDACLSAHIRPQENAADRR